VTTRGRKLWVLKSLRRGLHALAARLLVLCSLAPDLVVVAMFTLPPRREPVADFAQAFRILTVALMVTPGLVLALAPFAQADSRARAAPSGLGTPFSLTLARAHGRFDLPREKLGEDVSPSSSGVIKKRGQDDCLQIYRLATTKTKTRTKRLLAALSACGEQDEERNSVRNVPQKETRGSRTSPVALSIRSRMAPTKCTVPIMENSSIDTASTTCQ
jgi:hypothetical protein